MASLNSGTERNDMNFNTWLDTLVSEKGIQTDQRFDVEGPSGTNSMEYGHVIEAIKQAPKHEQANIKTTLVKIDFANGDICHFFRHLAQAIAI
jgi:hypothetical protein